MNRIMIIMTLLLPSVVWAMQPLEDEQLAQITGQSLLVADYIAPSGGAGSTTDFHYYRMGLDALVEMNMNIDKLQLGCGGYNEAVRPNSCDIDLDYVSFLGRYTDSGNNPNQAQGAGKAGDPVASDFKLTRPYFEIAVRDIGGGQREIAGFKIGAQEADGFMGIGRKYANGEWNEEIGVRCNTSDPVTCHSGINSISGHLDVEVSAALPITADTRIPLVPTFSGTACFGQTALDPQCASRAPYYTTQSGTRLNALQLDTIELAIDLGFLSVIGLNKAYARVDQNLRFIHGFAANETSDFFISFQRESIRYPSYDKQTHSAAANTGWWLNIPSVEVLDVQGDRVTLSGLTNIVNALGSPGTLLKDLELNTVPPQNCYGSYQFC